MSDPLDRLQRLAACARQEHTPKGDVTQRVLERIRRERGILPVPLARFALGSAFAAAVVVVWSSSYVSALTDPLTSFFGMANALLP